MVKPLLLALSCEWLITGIDLNSRYGKFVTIWIWIKYRHKWSNLGKADGETHTFSSRTLAMPPTSINSILVLSPHVLRNDWWRLLVVPLNTDCWPVTSSAGQLKQTPIANALCNVCYVTAMTDSHNTQDGWITKHWKLELLLRTGNVHVYD